MEIRSKEHAANTLYKLIEECGKERIITRQMGYFLNDCVYYLVKCNAEEVQIISKYERIRDILEERTRSINTY